MYAAALGFTREPFSIAPDPQFLFLGEMHREALAHLLYGLRAGGGFVLLTGEIGAGKTTVCRAFVEQLPPHCVLAYVFNPKLSALELLQTVCDEFGATVAARQPGQPPTLKDHVDALNAFLLRAHAEGRQALLVIDEAQALEPAVLEQLRLLTNLETRERKLLQIVLAGQPELRDLLAQPGLEQLAQRVVARCHLPALGAAETAAYVRHRLAVAAAPAGDPARPDAGALFDDAALAEVHRLSGGVPRRINLLCDRALLGTWARGAACVDAPALRRAAAELAQGPQPVSGSGSARARSAPARGPLLAAAGVGGVAALAVAAVVWGLPWAGGQGSVAAGAAVTQAPGTVTGAVVAPVIAAQDQSEGAVPGGAAVTAGGAAVAATLAMVLADAHRNEAEAWRELARAWQLVLPDDAGAEPCRAAALAGLACHRGQGGPALLRPLDRPALLPLRADGAVVWVLLTALHDDAATVQAAGRQWRVPLATLASAWRGDFATLWRPPPGWGGPAAGDATALQRWLAERLRAASAEAGGVALALPLREQIRAFQIVHGLPADGQAGPLTLMALARQTPPAATAAAAASQPLPGERSGAEWLATMAEPRLSAR